MAETNKADAPQEIFLKNYQPPAYEVPTVELDFDIKSPNQVFVTNRSHYQRAEGAQGVPLVLDGTVEPFFKLQSIKLDGRALIKDQDYSIDPKCGALSLLNPPAAFDLEIVTELDAASNQSGVGLYESGGTICTQCESEGFRNITYALDRPDVLSKYKVTIEADKQDYPHMLANAGTYAEEDLGNGRHRVSWDDQRPKPCYLFALGAAKLDVLKDSFTYPDGEEVELRVYVDEGKLDRAGFAMECLKNAFAHEYERWGHKYHGLDYGNPLFMVLAVDKFNFLAMENNGLNIFNSQGVLAKASTATDMDHFAIDSVIDHEYCHDETGNWQIPNSWFQISLKEGLTVFRDQTYTSDLYDETIDTIDRVNELRNRVFPEDDGATTHPMVLPSYVAAEDNYDALTYPKGAMVNRMVQTLVGKEEYSKAYRAFHDNPVPATSTINDYFEFIAKHSGKDLSQFIDSWTTQSGIPKLEVAGEYNPEAQTYTLMVNQQLPKTASKPFHLPLTVGLVGQDGQDIALNSGGNFEIGEGGVLDITKDSQSFTFTDVTSEPKLSLNRDMSAYAKIVYAPGHEPSPEDKAFLARHDANLFKRWDTLQELCIDNFNALLAAKKNGSEAAMDGHLLKAFHAVLADQAMGDHLKATMLTLPSEDYLANLQPKGTVDPVAIHEVREFMRQEIARVLEQEFLDAYQAKQSNEPYVYNPQEMGRRALMNTCLGYLCQTPDRDHTPLAKAQFDRSAENFNDLVAATAVLCHSTNKVAKHEAVSAFFERYKDDQLAMNKWLALLAGSDHMSVDEVSRLTELSVFDKDNPNKLRSVIGAFQNNVPHFHQADGEGYGFIADWLIKIDEYNPGRASRFAYQAFGAIADYEPWRQQKMLEQLERVRAERGEEISEGLAGMIAKIEKASSVPHAIVEGASAARLDVPKGPCVAG